MMTDRERRAHNFRLARARVRGMSREERHTYLWLVRYGPLGPVVAAILRANSGAI